MNYYSIYFSPTGGTKRVMDILSGELAEKHTDIDISAPDADYSVYTFGPEDVCLIGVPSFGGRVPAIALEHLRCMNADSTKAVLVTAFGNRAYDDTLLELKNEASARGFIVTAAVAAVTEHSIMHQYGKARPDTDDEKELRQFAVSIREKLNRPGNAELAGIPGNEPYREYNGVPLKPRAGKTCTHCGKCASLCPVLAIPLDRPSETDHERCISCMRCIAVCPSHARSLNSAILLASGQMLKKACSGRKPNELII